ncbi:hypothetical protein F4779DRAFT_148612 [Xylariaceae sp. FL0662B]|nr:hypothetical protein F4779DRAFT_148612 [Xylariaceae sp. FL0662B]
MALGLLHLVFVSNLGALLTLPRQTMADTRSSDHRNLNYGEMDEFEFPLKREEIVSSCPGLGASPRQVRDWFKTYLFYRGLDPDASENVFWRGEELHRATFLEISEAFKAHCGLFDWEANLLAYDVYSILEKSIPPPTRTLFQRYLEHLVEPDYYRRLMFYAKINVKAMDVVVGVFGWIFLGLTHIIALFTIFTIFAIIMSY